MSMRNMSAWSIRNPIVPLVAFAGLMVAGIIAFVRMDINQMPDVTLPAAVVSVSQPGAAPQEIENQITQKIEGAVRSISGVEEISSTASEGSSQTSVGFAVGTDPDVAVNEVKNAVDQIRSELPDGVLEPHVYKVDASGGDIGLYSVSADDMTMEQLSWFVDDTVSKRLLAIEGMSKVSRAGGVDREIRVVVDPERMASLGVTADKVNSALRQVNTNATGGQAEIAGSRQSVRVLGNARNAYDLSQTRINIGGGRSVKLTDFATVRDSYSEKSSIARLDGREVVTFSFQRSRSASEVAVYDQARAELKKIEADYPGVHFTALYSPVEYTRAQYRSSLEALMEGALLAIVIVYLFLRDWRATVISALAIPLSAIPTFWFMEMLGFTLNVLSLLGLSLVAGVLVDDAIVEIENIVRHMRMGKTAYQASIDAADEIGLAVVATTASIVAVFLPVGLMSGVSGQFFKAFGLTVVAAVLMSLAVARLITPMVAAYFLKAHGHAEHGGGRIMDLYMRVLHWTLDDSRSKQRLARLPRRPSRWWYYAIAWLVFALLVALGLGGAYFMFNGVHEALQKLGLDRLGLVVGAMLAPVMIPVVVIALSGPIRALLCPRGAFGRWYERATDRLGARMRDHRVYAVLAAVYSMIMTVALLAGAPQQFQPENNNNTSIVTIEMVPGTTIEQTDAEAQRVAEILRRQPEVTEVLATAREGSGDLYVSLKPASQRDVTSSEFEQRVAPEFQSLPDARVNFYDQNSGGASGRDISIMLSGSNPELLTETARTLVDQMRGVPGLVSPRIGADLQRPELIIVPRLDLAAQLGVTTSSLSQTIRIATIGEIDQNAAKFSLSDRQVPIRVMLAKTSRQDIANIENLAVPTGSGGSVPLKRVAEIRFGAGPTTIQRFNQSRRVIIGADLGPGAIKGTVTNAIQALPIMKNLPSGIANQAVGQDKWQAQMVTNFKIAVVSGIFLVFAVLVLLYKRVISPLVNMGSLLLAPLGGVIALTVIDSPLSMPVFIGILMLLGIVAKNSILLIDFAIEEIARGVPKTEAIIEAGHKRAQPIVMTTVAMTAGMVPTALSLTGDSSWRAPMGITVIGGLLLSTLLTLVIVPAAFSLADGFEKRVGPRLRKLLLTFEPHHAEPEPRGGAAQPAE